MTSNPGLQNQDAELGTNEPPPAYGAATTGASNTVDLAPPPSYEDAAKDAPPAYSALYGQMQEASRESSGFLDYVKKVAKLILSTFGVTIFMMVVLAIPLAMVVMGCLFFNDCPIDKKIPIFLVAMGAVYIMKNMADLRNRWQQRYETQREVRAPKEYQDFFSRLLGCFCIVFFITGNVWIYSVYPIVDTVDSESENYCNPILYYFSFWLITVIYIICGLTCCCICCTAGAAMSTSPSSSASQQ